MARLVIEIPDDLANRLQAHPLPLPVDGYCRRALEDADARAEENRLLAASVSQPSRGTPAVYDYKEAAALLHCSYDSIRRRVKAGELPVLATSGRRKVIPARVIENLIEQAVETAGDPELSAEPRKVRRRASGPRSSP